MVLFNFKTILKHSKYSTNEFLSIFRYITFKPKTAFNEKEAKRARVNWSGGSYLINPRLLLRNRGRYPDKQVVEYIALASLRNYSDYKIMGVKTLDLLACAGKEDLINNNRLLRLADGKVYFKYEEADKEM